MLYFLLIERKKERKKENKRRKGPGLFSQDRPALFAIPGQDFPAC
jgi:hypothetical protein